MKREHAPADRRSPPDRERPVAGKGGGAARKGETRQTPPGIRKSRQAQKKKNGVKTRIRKAERIRVFPEDRQYRKRPGDQTVSNSRTISCSGAGVQRDTITFTAAEITKAGSSS